MTTPQVIQVMVPTGPQTIRVDVPTGPHVIRVNIAGLQGPPGEDGTGGASTRNVRAATGTITVDPSTDDDIAVGAGAATINLPAASARTEGRSYLIIDAGLDADTNTKTITPNGSDTIRGLSSYTITFRGGVVELWPSTDDGGWYAREG